MAKKAPVSQAKARKILSDGEVNGKKLTKKQRKARLDQLAAQIMLTAYLESGARGQQSPGGIQ